MTESADLAVLKVFYPQIDSILYTTTVLFTWYDIVSDYGGILSLCLGCSIISFVEIIYFVTVRFYQNLFNSASFMKNFAQKARPNIFGGGRNLYRPKFEYIHWAYESSECDFYEIIAEYFLNNWLSMKLINFPC